MQTEDSPTRVFFRIFLTCLAVELFVLAFILFFTFKRIGGRTTLGSHSTFRSHSSHSKPLSAPGCNPSLGAALFKLCPQESPLKVNHRSCWSSVDPVDPGHQSPWCELCYHSWCRVIWGRSHEGQQQVTQDLRGWPQACEGDRQISHAERAWG